MDGIYEFIDTPGIGESFDRFEFESVLKLVAKDSDVIVPVVSFKELARSDWRKLPDMVANNFGKQASTIVCTHLDQIHGENLTEQMATVSKVFWPRTPWHEAAHRIVPCSSLIGMSARSLIKRSTQHKPSFESIWDPKGNKLEYHCAEKILGTGQPDMAFTRMNTEIWMNTLEKELNKSGLPVAIRRLTKEMVDQAKRHALLMENDTVLRQLRRMSTIHERKLVENRRTAADFAEARKEYEIKRSKLQRYIQSCERFEHETIWPYIQRLNHGIRVIETTSYPKTGIALKKTLVEWCISPSPASKSRNTTAYHSPRQNPEETLIVYNKAEAEDFLRSSQLHLCSSLDQDYWGYIDAVKSLAEEAGIARLQALGKQVDILEDHLIPNYLGGANKPNEKRSLELQEVTFQHIKHLTKKSKQQHDPSTSSKKLEERQNKSPGSNPSDSIWRGPANNLATHAISLYIWPGKAQPGAIQLPLAALENQYRDRIVTPWLRRLREEGERLLQQAIKDSDQLMQALLQKSVEREDRRFQREGAQKESRSKMGVVQHTVAMNSNLWAAESALLAIRSMLKDGLPQA
ncbi:hypothetical protein CPB86DRAFT_181593 [Serendipita vermifera]|nr:hypothetical protein CPB86DRAFT_181593 [Serendipita vermifera]